MKNQTEAEAMVLRAVFEDLLKDNDLISIIALPEQVLLAQI